MLQRPPVGSSRPRRPATAPPAHLSAPWPAPVDGPHEYIASNGWAPTYQRLGQPRVDGPHVLAHVAHQPPALHALHLGRQAWEEGMVAQWQEEEGRRHSGSPKRQSGSDLEPCEQAACISNRKSGYMEESPNARAGQQRPCTTTRLQQQRHLPAPRCPPPRSSGRRPAATAGAAGYWSCDTVPATAPCSSHCQPPNSMHDS